MDAIKTRDQGSTFAVHDVVPAAAPLRTAKSWASISSLLAANKSNAEPILACSGYNSDCVENVFYHPLIATVHLAFSQHRPLALSPDMIWILIVQGLAQHVRNNEAALRDKIVKHQGRIELLASGDDILPGSPESPWEKVIADLSGSLHGQLGERYDRLICNFSTTGDVERTACEVALLDVFQPYFAYAVECICGIPSITLEGNANDWKILREKVECLTEYDLDWWLPDLRLILSQFERASCGDVDALFWKNIYKQTEAYGRDIINGWIVRLVPYLKSGSGNFNLKNSLIGSALDLSEPLLQKEAQRPLGFGDPQPEGISSTSLPSGISMVPFRQIDAQGQGDNMQILGGFFGVEQDAGTLTLRPKVGWAVRKAAPNENMTDDLPKGSTLHSPLTSSMYDAQVRRLVEINASNIVIPNDFLAFYRRCDGIDFPGASSRVRSLSDVSVLKASLASSTRQLQPATTSENYMNYGRFCDFSDGTYVVMHLSAGKRNEPDQSKSPWNEATSERQSTKEGATAVWQEWTNHISAWSAQPNIFRVFHVDAKTGKGQIVAASFDEFTQALIMSGGQRHCVESLRQRTSVAEMNDMSITVT